MYNICRAHTLSRPIVVVALADAFDLALLGGIEPLGKFRRRTLLAIDMVGHIVVQSVEGVVFHALDLDGRLIVATTDQFAV